MPRPDAAALPRVKGALFAALVSSATLALGFAGVEAVARRREAGLQSARLPATGLRLMRANPHGTGSYRLAPGLDLAVQIKRRGFRIRTNSHGLHWREVEHAKPRGRRRVAFLGDSFTFGCWAPDVEHSFVGVFERLGNPARVEALNFGVGGYGVDDMELLLREEVFGFEPDWIIVALFVGNDFRDTWLGLDKYRLEDGQAKLREELYAERVPEVFRRAEFFQSPAAPDPSRLRRALTTFATFRLLLPALGWDNPWIDFKVSREFTAFSFWSQAPPPPIVLRARERVLETLLRMDEVARSRGARLGVVTLPTREQVYCTRESGRDYDVQLPQAWVRVWAREAGVPFLDAWPALRRRALDGERLYLPDDIHFDGRGHAAAGELIREWFARELQPLRAP